MNHLLPSTVVRPVVVATEHAHLLLLLLLLSHRAVAVSCVRVAAQAPARVAPATPAAPAGITPSTVPGGGLVDHAHDQQPDSEARHLPTKTMSLATGDLIVAMEHLLSCYLVWVVVCSARINSELRTCDR